MRTTFKLLLICLLTTPRISFSQKAEPWDLRRCVEYALQNNISVRQADLQARFSEVTYSQAKAGQFPSLNFNSSPAYRFGRSENPATGVLVDNNFFSLGMQLQSQVTIFNWFSVKNSMEAARLTWQADREQVSKAQNDIALNVAVAYLQVLLAREQVNLTRVQINQTREQLSVTRKKVDAGALPELSAAELEAQLARDSSAWVSAVAGAEQMLLQMKALLNLDAATPFDIVVPNADVIPVETLGDLQPDAVYASAVANLPQQRINELRLQSARKNVEAARGMMYPSLSAFAGLGTSYVNERIPEYGPGAPILTTSFVNVGGSNYFVQTPSFVKVGERSIPVGRQFRNNFGQSIGVGISVPILNGRSARSGWDRARLQVQQWELTIAQDNMDLKQDIYRAYHDAAAALQKFNAAKKIVETSEKAYDFAQKRFELALLSTFDLLTIQNNLQRARIDMLYAQYDYLFKIKLLEFYKGQGIKI